MDVEGMYAWVIIGGVVGLLVVFFALMINAARRSASTSDEEEDNGEEDQPMSMRETAQEYREESPEIYEGLTDAEIIAFSDAYEENTVLLIQILRELRTMNKRGLP